MPTSFSRTTRSLVNDSSLYAIVAWLIGGLILTGWMIWFFYTEITVYEISTTARLEVNRSAHPIATPVAGKIISTSLSLGQKVKKGEVLIILDTENEDLRLQEEESRLRALPPQIASLEKQISDLEQSRTKGYKASQAAIQSARLRKNEASSAVEFAKDHEQRLIELSNSGKIPLIETLRAKSESKKLISARDALSKDIRRIKMDAQTQGHEKLAEIENLKREAARLTGDLETTQIRISLLKQNIEKHFIKAPATGKIGDVTALQIGTYVSIGDKLGSVVPNSKLRIVADFPPAAVLGRIHPGQLSHMRLDGFPWSQFGTIKAHVSRVGSEIRDNVVRVEFSPTMSSQSLIILQHGLPGSIEVNIEQITPAIMVLRSAGQLLTHSNQPQQPISEHKT